MPETTIFLQVEETEYIPKGTDVLINWELLKEIGISVGKKIGISFGSRRIEARIGTHNASRSIILMHPVIAQKLLIPYSMNLVVNYSHKSGMKLGTVLGILVSNTNFSSLNESYSSFITEIFEAAQKVHCFCYVVSLDQINLEENHAHGWVYKNSSWQDHTLPLPNVFYNRLGSRLQEKSGDNYETLQKIKASGIPIFNDRFLDKWDVYQLLSKTQYVHNLPHTVLYEQPQDLIRMVKLYPILYIKPIYGSEGKGILRLHRKTSEYVLEQVTVNRTEKRYFAKFSEVAKYIRPKIRRRYYLIQQGIHFLEWEGQTVDFRALLQKNRQAQWKVISLIARLGNPNTFVSNLAQGGKLMSSVQLLKQMRSHYPKLPTIKEIQNFAINMATALDEQIEGNFGELGIDLGIDRNSRLWLIEMNAKPSKKNDATLNTASGPRPSVVHLFEYVHYLDKNTQKAN